ncbi:MAG: baseplate J/gp47 family protein [Bacteroidetes bacterium]|nr:baseplate J/gp47 family protein [Bacteroidota bacterium]
MSAQNCHRCTNPLLRDGTSQPQRFFSELEPSYVLIDERTTIDLIDFSRRYAQKIRFWELDNATTGNWVGFVENDIATLHSIISKKNGNDLRAAYQQDIAAFNLSLDPDDFQKLINKSIDMAFEMDDWYKKSLPGFSLNADLLKIIQSQAAPNLQILAGYDRGAQATLIIDPVVPVYPLPYSQLSAIWGVYSLTSPAIDTSIYTNTTNDQTKMQSAIGSITSIFESMVNAQEKLAVSAFTHFDKILEEYPEHKAHFTLMLAFFKLFEHPQEFLNQITKRHLDFYYKEVLQLVEKNAVPDQAHLVFEAAKNIEAHLIEKGTIFKAGKDDTGKDILFGTDRDVIINRAKVESVKNVFIHKNIENNVDYIFAAPVADSLNGNGDEPNLTGWKLFGQHQKQTDQGGNESDISLRTMSDANVGFAIASPELFLKEGERTIEFEFQFDNTSFGEFVSYFDSLTAAAGELKNQLKIYFSGEETWIQPESTSLKEVVVNSASHTLKLVSELAVEQPAIVPYNQQVLGDPFVTEWPVAKILIDQSTASVVYQALQRLKISSYTISVSVKEAVSLVVANDNGTLDASKPFQPFGAVPEIGANFYIGSAEIFSRKLTELSVTMDWHNVPSSNLADYYKVFNKTATTKYINHNKDFSAKLKLLDNYRWWDIVLETHTTVVQQAEASTNENFPVEIDVDNVADSSTTSGPFAFLLFAFLFRFSPSSKINRTELFNHEVNTDPRLPKTTTITNIAVQAIPTNQSSVVVDKTFQLLPYVYKRDVYLQKENITGYTNTTKRGFIKFELNSPGFLHDVYPKIQTKQAIALAKYTTGVEPQLPNEPYTPTVKLLGIDYKSEHTVNYGQPEFQDYEKRIEQLFHVGPFGVAEIFPVEQDEVITENTGIYLTDNLLPKFINEPETNVSVIANGVLYIGIKDLDPPRSLTLFFQFDKGTENPDLDVSTVTWSYLANNQWTNFDARQVIYDSTNGLVNSGIIELSVPQTITAANTMLTSGLHWLRVQTFDNTEAFSNIITIKAQAVSATYVDTANDPERLRKLIDPLTISKFVKKDFAVKTVEQPYSSFGGRIKEQSNEFYARAAERLRHKNRAVTVRDYEHLVLEAFPEIYKVKCINHTSKTSENAPGNVSVITVLDPKLRNDKNPFELKVSKSDLETVKRFLQLLNSTFVNLDVRNPRYEKIELNFKVVFLKEFSDETFYSIRLADDIRRFLSPWAFGEQTEIIFGGRLEKSVILNFIEERPYVDYVTDFVMQQYLSETDLPVTGGIEEAIAQTASSILITNDTHIINGDKY